MNCILNDIATCNFLFQWLCLHFTVTNNSCQVWLCTKKSANTFIAVVHLTINFFSNYQHLVVVFTAALSPSIAIHSHFYWYISQIIITLKGELLLSKCNCILTGSYPPLPPFPFDHNYTCRRVKWGAHGIGPMQHLLTRATPFKSQKILFIARALGSNSIHRGLSTSQLPILDPPSPVTWFLLFLSCPPTPYGLPPRALRGSVIHVFLVTFYP